MSFLSTDAATDIDPVVVDQCFVNTSRQRIKNVEIVARRLTSSEAFIEMVNALCEEEVDPRYILADAILLGMELGRLKTETLNLEYMVKLKPRRKQWQQSIRTVLNSKTTTISGTTTSTTTTKTLTKKKRFPKKNRASATE